jgi:hypothetical protein
MKIAVVANPSATHQTETAQHIVKGFQRHGQAVELLSSPPVDGFDLVVMWGVRRREVFQRQRRHGGRVLVMERAYLGDRYRWISLGFDGLNGRADFGKIDRGPERAAKHWAGALKPWAPFENGHGQPSALIMGQCPGDMSLNGLRVADWVEKTAADLASKGWAVFLRPHPLAPPERRVKIPEAIPGPFDLVVRGFDLVVTYSSNSGVDAMLAGVPVVAMDQGSMVWPIASRSLDSVQLCEPDRQTWLDRLAWCQWLPEEVAAGDAWDHLKDAAGLAYFGYSVDKMPTESRGHD